MTETKSEDRSNIALSQAHKKTDINPIQNVEIRKISSGLMLAQYYNSESEDEDDNEDTDRGDNSEKHNLHAVPLNENMSVSGECIVPEGILLPPPELRVIIDKTASYVLKNGKEFEDILRAKNDQRFTFLQYKDQYHNYYIFKVRIILLLHLDVKEIFEYQRVCKTLYTKYQFYLKNPIAFVSAFWNK